MLPSTRRRTALPLLAFVLLAVACGDGDGGATARAGASATGGATGAPVSTAAASTLRFGADTLSDSALIALMDRGRMRGKEGADVWLVMISDFQCPYCKLWHDSTSGGVYRDYVDAGRVRMAYLNLPLPQHPHARKESEASLCAGAQGKFWEYADGLFHAQEQVAKLATIDLLLDSLARANHLDLRAFAHCRQSKAVKAVIDSDVQQATRARIRSTPSFLVGEFLVEGASRYPDFRKALDTALVLARAKKK